MEIWLPTAEKRRLIQKRPKSLCARTCQGVTCRVTGFVMVNIYCFDYGFYTALTRTEPKDDAAELLDSAHGEAGDETIDKKIVQNGDGNAGDETAGHEGTPKVYIAMDQESRHADAHGHISHRGDEGHSIDELLHYECETEDRDSEYSGEGNRNNHTEERPETAIAVDHSGLFHILWDSFDETHHQPGREGDGERWVDQHQRPQRIVEVKIHHDPGWGNEQERGGNSISQE